MSDRPSASSSACSTNTRLLTHTWDCATCRDSPHVDVSSDGRVTLTWQASTDFSEDRGHRGGSSTPTLDSDELDVLRSLAETADEQSVRRAALAVLRRVNGATLQEAVEPTPYGIGWLRGLVDDVEEHGVSYLEEREYRSPRE